MNYVDKPREEIEKELIAAAILWWKYKRPLDMTENIHCVRSSVNCFSTREKTLAQKCALLTRWERCNKKEVIK